MKKPFLYMAAWSVILTTSANCLPVSAMSTAPEQMQAQIPNLCPFVNPSEVKPLGSLKAGLQPSAHRVPARLNSESDMITDPQGTKQDVTISGSGYYVADDWSISIFIDQSMSSNVVYGEDNEVYILNILPYAATYTYTKGTISGDEVTIELPQTLYYSSAYENGYNLTMFTYSETQGIDENGEPLFDENGEPIMYGTYIEDENPGSITFKIGDDDVWRTSILTPETPDKLLGLSYCSGDGWTGYGAVDLTIAPSNDKLIEVPADIEVSENYWSLIMEDCGWTVNFAQGGDELYFQGLSSHFPEAWLKATVEYGDTDATVSFAPDQYVGTYYAYRINLKFAKVDDQNNWTLMPNDYKYELTWDLEENTMKAKDKDVYFLFNTLPNQVFYISGIQDMTFIHQDSFEGIPADPNSLLFSPGMEDYGYDIFYFNVPSISTSGNLLLSDNLYYVVYVDGDEWEFDADEYMIPESLIEIPWDYNAYYIYNYGAGVRQVAFFVEGISTIGVQSVYYYDGEETRSDIVTLDLDSNVAVEKVDADKEVATVTYLDLAGRAITNPVNGVYLKVTTYTDGTTVTSKKLIR